MNLNDHNPITAAGSYDIPVIPGQEYLVTLKGTWTGTSTATLQFDNGPSGAFDDVESGVLDEDTAEARVVAPSGTLRIVAAGFSGAPSLQITVIPLL